ncbi:MAG: hypothetical protein JW804_01335, partial [Sedimentisphaerales bacterium]|nr:hypothetical protein [Sedimentisphaerales bacterium]
MKRFTKIVTVLFIAISTPFLIADQKEDILKPLDTEGLHFLRKSEPQPDGRIKVGGLVVTKEPGQKYAMVEMARLTNNSYSKENIDIRLIPEIPTGITGPGSQLK